MTNGDDRIYRNWVETIPKELGPVYQAKVMDGSAIDAIMEARPDFGRVRWYWSCEWRKRTKKVHKRNKDGSYPLPVDIPRRVKWGIAETAKDAKIEAEKCYRAGPPID